MSTVTRPSKNQLAAWSVHAFTMTGIVWACLAAGALIADDIRMMWLWLGVALVVDAVDGTMARKADVKTHAPWFDGSILDIVVDYLTWTFIPAVFMYLYLPMGPGPIPMLMLIWITGSSLFCYCNTKMKTDDYYFMGFPAAWNVVAAVCWLFGTPWWFTVAASVVLGILTLAPITFVHPLRVAWLRPVNIAAAVAWIGATAHLVWTHPDLAVVSQVIFWASGAWIMALSTIRTVRGRLDSEP